MPNGGEVKIKVYQNNSNIAISIHDAGTGITKDDQKRVFSPLFTTKSKGMGPGRPVTQRIIRAHSGEIKFSSEPGKWTTSTIQLPGEMVYSEAGGRTET